ncbi:hypothetical protein HBI56_237750 [Parastagonospora nodorum]|nr:hypothetical protein HBH53_115110 [Parastagonospora nodorum]KAH3968921.1 hypothetical protein HBH52_174730 [Parastagonospora nodorum]KAH3990976.1 hypothetical protein HBI10_240330 [Parastagonospora nodorum]KAH4010363.1 hypothetical protein HBI09_231700 [Parastagonospora nodorum]KAH4019356.1 hypothetical protein HBI13_122890 [Parastagonospora nodorum]
MGRSPPSGAAVLACYGTLLLLAFFMIVARLYLRIQIHKARRLLLSDCLMAASWCAALTTASFDIVFYKQGALSPKTDYTLINFDAPVETYEYVAKMVWASVIPFYATLWLCKLSLIAIYFQLFPIFMVKLRIALWVTLGFCISSWIVSMCLQIFLCWPVEGNWRVSRPELLCPGTVPQTIFQTGWALHFIGSVVVFVLPFFVIHNIQMRRSMMVGVYGALSLGAIDIAFSLTRFLEVQTGNVGDFRAITTIELWSCLDIMVGLIVTCLPSLRPYLRKGFKNSSAGTDGPSNAYGNSQSIVVNRKVITSSTSGRWNDHNQFEEIVGGEGSSDTHSEEGQHGRIITIGNDVHVGGGRNASARDSWQDDKRSNKSDVELIQIKV